jgi:hypothetical protein
MIRSLVLVVVAGMLALGVFLCGWSVTQLGQIGTAASTASPLEGFTLAGMAWSGASIVYYAGRVLMQISL